MPQVTRTAQADTDIEEILLHLFGVYSREQKAVAARIRGEKLPGFRDNLTGFHIDCYEVDEDHWTSGFVTVRYGENGEPHNAEPGPGE